MNIQRQAAKVQANKIRNRHRVIKKIKSVTSGIEDPETQITHRNALAARTLSRFHGIASDGSIITKRVAPDNITNEINKYRQDPNAYVDRRQARVRLKDILSENTDEVKSLIDSINPANGNVDKNSLRAKFITIKKRNDPSEANQVNALGKEIRSLFQSAKQLEQRGIKKLPDSLRIQMESVEVRLNLLD